MRILLAVLCVLALGADAARAQWIGIYADPQSTALQINATAYVPTTFYLTAHDTQGLNPPGFQGAEFAVQHDITPAEALITVWSNPVATVVAGDPFGEGTNIAWPSCQTEASVVLYSVSLLVVDQQAMTDRFLSIVKHSTPSNPNFQCPVINQCDVPVFTALCAVGGGACINDVSGNCVLAVEESTWGAVKKLYAH